MKFTYAADRVGAYVAPASTFFVQSAVAEGGKMFLVLLAHLMRQYPGVYGLAVDTARVHECGEN